MAIAWHRRSSRSLLPHRIWLPNRACCSFLLATANASISPLRLPYAICIQLRVLFLPFAIHSRFVGLCAFLFFCPSSSIPAVPLFLLVFASRNHIAIFGPSWPLNHSEIIISHSNADERVKRQLQTAEQVSFVSMHFFYLSTPAYSVLEPSCAGHLSYIFQLPRRRGAPPLHTTTEHGKYLCHSLLSAISLAREAP